MTQKLNKTEKEKNEVSENNEISINYSEYVDLARSSLLTTVVITMFYWITDCISQLIMKSSGYGILYGEDVEFFCAYFTLVATYLSPFIISFSASNLIQYFNDMKPSVLVNGREKYLTIFTIAYAVLYFAFLVFGRFHINISDLFFFVTLVYILFSLPCFKREIIYKSKVNK